MIFPPQDRGLQLEGKNVWMPISQSPVCKKVQDELLPYLHLYQTATEFQAEHQQWLNGPLTSINPDKVVNDISNYWRSLYKLEKGFQDSPSALHLTIQVKAEVKNFRQHIPLLQVLMDQLLYRGPKLSILSCACLMCHFLQLDVRVL